MHVRADEASHLVRLLRLLIQGEHLARDTALQQAAIMQEQGNLPVAKFLRSQARQELFHARVFQSVGLWLGSAKKRNSSAESRYFAEYSGLIESALSRRSMAETVLGVQVMLEGMGEVLLSHLNSGMEKREMGLAKVRRTILFQEAAHHTFGNRRLEHIMAQEGVGRDAMRGKAKAYLDLNLMVLDEMAPIFEGLDEDINLYKQELVAEVPAWMQP